MAETLAGRDVGAVSVCHPGVSFGQWQRVHQSRDCWVAEQITDRADEIPPTAFQRQWSGRGQEWSGDPETHGLPLHRRAARGKGPGVLPGTSESVSELPSTVRTTRNPCRCQGQGEASVSAVCDALGSVSSVAQGRTISEAGPDHGATPAERRRRERHRKRTAHATSKAEVVYQVPPGAPPCVSVTAGRIGQAVEMTEPWKPWKTKRRFSTVPTAPWKSGEQRRIPTFPQPRRLVCSFQVEHGSPRAPPERSGPGIQAVNLTIPLMVKSHRSGSSLDWNMLLLALNANRSQHIRRAESITYALNSARSVVYC